jgi:hypothetical protein
MSNYHLLQGIIEIFKTGGGVSFTNLERQKIIILFLYSFGPIWSNFQFSEGWFLRVT